MTFVADEVKLTDGTIVKNCVVVEFLSMSQQVMYYGLNVLEPNKTLGNKPDKMDYIVPSFVYAKPRKS